MRTLSTERPARFQSPRQALGNWFTRIPEVNWCQVTIAAMAVFAIAMEFMFPPSRILLANGSSVYAGHFVAHDPLVNVQVDYICLVVELIAVIAVAAIGWKFAESR